jgi:hypothetical protein
MAVVLLAVVLFVEGRGPHIAVLFQCLKPLLAHCKILSDCVIGSTHSTIDSKCACLNVCAVAKHLFWRVLIVAQNARF